MIVPGRAGWLTDYLTYVRYVCVWVCSPSRINQSLSREIKMREPVFKLVIVGNYGLCHRRLLVLKLAYSFI